MEKVNWTDLLHVAENILTAVEDTLALLWIQVEDEVGGVVGITVFIPVRERQMCAPEDLMKRLLKWHLMVKTHLRIKPLFTVVFIFSTRCSTFVYKPPETVRTERREVEGSDFTPHLQVSNVKFLLEDVGRVCASGQAGHGGQVAAVPSHRLHDEHAALGPRRWLFDPVAGLRKRRKRSGVQLHSNLLVPAKHLRRWWCWGRCRRRCWSQSPGRCWRRWRGWPPLECTSLHTSLWPEPAPDLPHRPVVRGRRWRWTLGGGKDGVAAAAHLESTDDHQSMDVKPGDVLADFLQHFSWQRSLHGREKQSNVLEVKKLQEKNQQFTFWCPTWSLLFQSSHWLKSRWWAQSVRTLKSVEDKVE